MQKDHSLPQKECAMSGQVPPGLSRKLSEKLQVNFTKINISSLRITPLIEKELIRGVPSALTFNASALNAFKSSSVFSLMKF